MSTVRRATLQTLALENGFLPCPRNYLRRDPARRDGDWLHVRRHEGNVVGCELRTGRPISPIPWILCFIGAGIFLLTAVSSSIYSIYFLSSSIQTTAVVAEIVERKDDEGHVSRTPVYNYEDASGEEFTDRSSTGDGRDFDVGDTIPIRYLKTSPHQSRIDYFAHHWMLPIFMAIFSTLLGGLGFGLRWWRNREQQWANKTLVATGDSAPV